MCEGIDCHGTKWTERQLKGRAEDLRRCEFTYLTPTLPIKILGKKHEQAGWLCSCRCGNEVAVTTARLKNGNTTSCGCRRYEIRRNQGEQIRLARIGTTFNSLLVKRLVGKIGQDQTLYEFECLKCGKIFQRTWESIRRNQTQDCGCTFLQRKAELRDSLIGEKIGKLTIKKYIGMNEHHDYLYECECECGNVKIIPRNSLLTKNTQSCGCLISAAENSITNILEKNHIPYKKQISFPDLRSPLNGILRYDFAILDDDGNIIHLIEFDGN